MPDAASPGAERAGTIEASAAFTAWAAAHVARVERALDALLPPATRAPQRLHAAMRYAVQGGGKRIRPLLAYAAAELGTPQAVDAAAAAVELIHAYSLVHDDLPAMDDDTLRRGKPTCHVAFGEATALLAGDALQALAFAALADGLPAHGAHACALLAHASGSMGMAGGQAIDLGDGLVRSVEDLATLHRLKTGALIAASVHLGALCGGLDDAGARRALDAYARAAGLAFQVIDDVLDVEGSAQALGKTPGKDAAQGKATFVAMLGLEGARAQARRLREEAHAALDPFGGRARRLRELADAMVQRQA
jgi:farnesyl diphosphate synthase